MSREGGTSPTLADPLPLACGGALPNRLAKSAMSEQLAGDGALPDQALVRLYERWSAGGAGLLVTGNVMVDARALGEPGNVVLERQEGLEAFAAWARAAKSRGAQVWMQLNHPGRQSPRSLSPQPVAPSAIGVKGMGPAFATPRALEAREVEEIVRRFAASAALAEQAGFDGVQLHAAHGYLISQFLSPLVNQRTDEWGGTPEKRRRFLLEIARSVRAAVRPGFALGVKLNSADFQRGGFSQEESLAVIEELGALGVDLLEVSGGTYERAAMWEGNAPQKASTQAREAYFLEFAEQARRVAKMPLMLTGGFRTLEGMNQALASGAIDVVGMARPLAAEPDLPARLLSGAVTAAKPIRLGVGCKKLNLLVEGTWYQIQIERMSRGLDPDPATGSFRALLRGIRASLGRPKLRA